jgi:transmembrane protein DUF3566
VDNREGSSRAAGEGSPGITADRGAAEDQAAADEPPAQETAAKVAEVDGATGATGPSDGPNGGVGGHPAVPRQNGSQRGSDSSAAGSAAAATAPSGTQPMPSLMAAAPHSGEAASIQDAAMNAMATAASGARGVASKITSSFSSITKPRPRQARFVASRQMRAPGGPPRTQTGRPQAGGAWAGQVGPAPRSALLSLQRIEPLSVMKFSFLLSLVAWVVVFVAVAIVWFVLSKLGVFAQIEKTVGLVTYTKDHPGANAANWFSAPRVLLYTALVCTVNAILFTALATVGAALYNAITSLTGGIEVTLRETD